VSGLSAREYYHELGGRFTQVNGTEMVAHFGDPMAEYDALRQSAGVLDLSSRGRLCVTGTDRKRFLHGQVTNEVNNLKPGEGCYAALLTAKGKMETDLNIYCLPDELLLDFEPGLSAAIAQRLEKYIIADDVQVTDVAADYGLLSVQGPKAGNVVAAAVAGSELPTQRWRFTTVTDPALGEIYCANRPRGAQNGFDLFVPASKIRDAFATLIAAANTMNGRACGWQALEMVRIEAGLPRFGIDMDETNLPPETGIEDSAISYAKGCYIGQEVIARIRTYGQVAKTLKRLRLADDLKELPEKGDKLFHGDKEAGYITSALASPAAKGNIALGYVRREFNQPGAVLTLRMAGAESPAQVQALSLT